MFYGDFGVNIDLVNWIEGFYNSYCLHSAIDYQSPAQYERHLSFCNKK
ncbi:hypothetical protein EBME_2280 [bacterium endosymbiont of Mortierella elongata FMR23-6]|nr:hypothetical protein EBME_2280 [bacterium endosymbiont of Mortierella elongata FMR23-6]